jgi:hypothetical protein
MALTELDMDMTLSQLSDSSHSSLWNASVAAPVEMAKRRCTVAGPTFTRIEANRCCAMKELFAWFHEKCGGLSEFDAEGAFHRWRHAFMSTQKSAAHLDPIIPSPDHCQREARLADSLETVLADAGMTPSQATDVVRQMAARCVTATAKLANERSTYERLLREHGNGDGRITKEMNKSVRVGKEWLW